MLFNSYIFVFAFFPICLAGYYLLLNKHKAKQAKLFLVLMSLWFYAYFEWKYLFILAASIAVNYAVHVCICKAGADSSNTDGDSTEIHSSKPGLWILVLGIIFNLGLLIYFKYTDFFLENISALTEAEYVLKNIALPLGISFFTFQQIGFIVDTYRGEIKRLDFLTYVLFVTFFPRMIEGPIVIAEEMIPQFEDMEVKKDTLWQNIAQGFVFFTVGLAKKVLIADTLGAGVDFGYQNLATLGRADAFLVMISYSLQLYFDFSGYCDMACGIGQMMGYTIPINFNSPYKATNIIDFWKRWHITLNRFFMRYVYIPLGGNRKGEGRMYLNLLVIFFLSGLWHGAGWNFIVWGMLHGVLYVITRFVQKHRKHSASSQEEKPCLGIWNALKKGVCTVLTFLYVSVAWVYFRAEDIAQANLLLKTMIVGNWQKLSMDMAEKYALDEFWYVLKVLHLDAGPYSRYILMFVMLIAGLYFAMVSKNAQEISKSVKGKTLSAILVGILFVWCVISFSGVSTFLYTNF